MDGREEEGAVQVEGGKQMEQVDEAASAGGGRSRRTLERTVQTCVFITTRVPVLARDLPAKPYTCSSQHRTLFLCRRNSLLVAPYRTGGKTQQLTHGTIKPPLLPLLLWCSRRCSTKVSDAGRWLRVVAPTLQHCMRMESGKGSSEARMLPGCRPAAR